MQFVKRKKNAFENRILKTLEKTLVFLVSKLENWR